MNKKDTQAYRVLHPIIKDKYGTRESKRVKLANIRTFSQETYRRYHEIVDKGAQLQASKFDDALQLTKDLIKDINLRLADEYEKGVTSPWASHVAGSFGVNLEQGEVISLRLPDKYSRENAAELNHQMRDLAEYIVNWTYKGDKFRNRVGYSGFLNQCKEWNSKYNVTLKPSEWTKVWKEFQKAKKGHESVPGSPQVLYEIIADIVADRTRISQFSVRGVKYDPQTVAEEQSNDLWNDNW